jgi:general secretion pathway protein I
MLILAHPRSSRHGLSLLEVLVALAIFLFSIVALNQAMNVGTKSALNTQQQIQAAQLAQSKMAEVYIGAVPLTSQPDTPFDEDPDYTWSLDVEQNTVANLWTATVTVSRAVGDGSKMETKLSQMIVDPSIRGTSYDSAYTATFSPPSSTGGGSSSSGSSGSSGSSSSPGTTPKATTPTTPATGPGKTPTTKAPTAPTTPAPKAPAAPTNPAPKAPAAPTNPAPKSPTTKGK